MYVLEVYSAVWSFHLVCALLILAPGIIREFLEEDIGPVPSLSVAPLGHLYLGLGLLATYTYGITLAQHYLWQTHVTALHAAITMNVICAVFTLVALLAPQVFITLALCEVKDRRLAKFAGPTRRPVALEEQERDRLVLKRTHSIWWFDSSQPCGSGDSCARQHYHGVRLFIFRDQPYLGVRVSLGCSAGR